MSDIHQTVGQLILGKIVGPRLDNENRELLANGTMSGVTLFRDNAESLQQLLELIEEARSCCSVDPIVTVDQEGGAIQRFDHVLSPLPSMMALGRTAPDKVFEVGRLAGEQLALLGINVVLAPVLDVNTNWSNPIIGSRAFGDDPEKVWQCGDLLARGYASSGVIPVGKHFPGHGDTSLDSHLHLPMIEHDLRRLEQVELLPFQKLCGNLPAMLTAHLRVPAMDPAPLPASLSRRITTDWLRNKLGFDGLIFTDDMLMKAISDNWGVEEACVLAVEAGADQLLVCAEPQLVARVHQAVVNSIKSGRISAERVQQSVARRKRTLSTIGAGARLLELSADERLSRLRQLIIRATALTESINTQVIHGSFSPECPAGLPAELTLVVPDHYRYPMRFKEAFTREASSTNLAELRYPLNPTETDIDELGRECAGRACALFTFRAPLNSGQYALADELSRRAEPWLAVAVDTPYDLNGIKGWKHTAVMYDPSEFAVECFAKVLTGLGKANR